MVNAEPLEELRTRLGRGERYADIAAHFGVSVSWVGYRAKQLRAQSLARSAHERAESEHRATTAHRGDDGDLWSQLERAVAKPNRRERVDTEILAALPWENIPREFRTGNQYRTVYLHARTLIFDTGALGPVNEQWLDKRIHRLALDGDAIEFNPNYPALPRYGLTAGWRLRRTQTKLTARDLFIVPPADCRLMPEALALWMPPGEAVVRRNQRWDAVSREVVPVTAPCGLGEWGSQRTVAAPTIELTGQMLGSRTVHAALRARTEPRQGNLCADYERACEPGTRTPNGVWLMLVADTIGREPVTCPACLALAGDGKLRLQLT